MQHLVKEFVKRHNLHSSAEIRYIDVVSEIGELGKEIIKGSSYGQLPYANSPLAAEEIGDCLFSLLALCNEMGINAQEALQSALAKYEQRFAWQGDIGSGR